MEFLLMVLLGVYIWLSIRAIKALGKKVDAQAKFISEYMGEPRVVHSDNKEKDTTVSSID